MKLKSIDRWAQALSMLCMAAMLAACGGGGGGSATETSASVGGGAGAVTVPVVPPVVAQTPAAPAAPEPAPAPVVEPVAPAVPEPAVAAAPPTRAEAARFLAQATFGPVDADIERVMAIGYAAWIEEQFTRSAASHRAYWDSSNAAIKAVDATQGAGQRQIFDSFYKQAVTGDAQLRQRVAFALSQVFVVSLQGDGVGTNSQGVAGYLDLLGEQAFGTYRGLLEQVALHPMMGVFLSHLKNQKEDVAKGRVPDQNFARESMQLFSLGLHQLNLDGTPKKDAAGEPLASYTPDDIEGLAKVFTGWSWYGPDTADQRFVGAIGHQDADRRWKPMQAYAKYHSASEKRFLGTSVAAGADAASSLKAALDALAAHPNVGPFIGRQLIQRLVTSHPSAAYVERVAKAFNDNGSGVRGDMKAVVKAVLLDSEARSAASTSQASFGKLREPVLRLTAVLRAFGAASDTGQWLIGNTDDPGTALGQSPFRAPSVFNFYRPGYLAPGTESGAAGLTAPELQITHETSVAGYANYMRNGAGAGFGQNGVDFKAARRDVQLDLTAELALADRPADLVERVATRLLGAAPGAVLKSEIVAAVSSVALPAPTATNQKQVDEARRNRTLIALFIVSVSPEFLVQK